VALDGKASLAKVDHAALLIAALNRLAKIDPEMPSLPVLVACAARLGDDVIAERKAEIKLAIDNHSPRVDAPRAGAVRPSLVVEGVSKSAYRLIESKADLERKAASKRPK
jgi:hypothetical protein